MPFSPICRLCGIMFADVDAFQVHLRARHEILPDEQTIVGDAASAPAPESDDALAHSREEEPTLA